MQNQFQLSDEDIKTVWGGSHSHAATIHASGPDDQGRDDPAPPVGDDQGRDDPAPPVTDDQGKDDGAPPPDDAGRDDT
jgi:hypothetical protein